MRGSVWFVWFVSGSWVVRAVMCLVRWWFVQFCVWLVVGYCGLRPGRGAFVQFGAWFVGGQCGSVYGSWMLRVDSVWFVEGSWSTVPLSMSYRVVWCLIA